jgi:phosphoglycerol transferase MdoB-like AlkP superfamily enzyme
MTSDQPPHSPNSLKRFFYKAFPSLLIRGLCVIVLLQIGVAVLTRLGLLLFGHEQIAMDGSLAASFTWGLWFDLLAAFYAGVVWWLLFMLVPSQFLRSQAGKLFTALLTGLYSMVFIFISVAEVLFWDEFQVRFNFIAVDYLVFTQEVINNIRQSYPMPAIYVGLAAAAAGIAALCWRLGIIAWVVAGDSRWWPRLPQTLAYAGLLTGITFGFNQGQLPPFQNEFNRELAKNGLYSFCAAFWESEIDFDRFYRTLPLEAALARARHLMRTPGTEFISDDAHELHRRTSYASPEKQWNVILITVESLSAKFLKHFEPKSKLTPYLDRMAREGILFENMLATGTRTVRGLEAITLSIPPTPGQSIIWRPQHEHLMTLGSQFRQRGYDTAYVYGGDAMFDNMNAFFSHNDYRVADRQKKKATDITFENAWGACDEDLLRWVTEEADADHTAGKPFFLHAMTTSNHRPFTFPDGRIDLPSLKGGRKAGVMYTDFAIGQFIAKTKSKPWFANTLFVIIADHCDGSAGKVELDPSKYRIPCIVWNPGLVSPYVMDRLASQIDLAPTLLGLLSWSHTSSFFGEDVLSPGYATHPARAWISNYQKIAYIQEDQMAILKPKKLFSVGAFDPQSLIFSPGTAINHQGILTEAIASYQAASWMFKGGHLSENESSARLQARSSLDVR